MPWLGLALLLCEGNRSFRKGREGKEKIMEITRIASPFSIFTKLPLHVPDQEIDGQEASIDRCILVICVLSQIHRLMDVYVRRSKTYHMRICRLMDESTF